MSSSSHLNETCSTCPMLSEDTPGVVPLFELLYKHIALFPVTKWGLG